jgi:hypothetical protein
MQVYCTFVLFVNQHFPGLPASGLHCITKALRHSLKSHINWDVISFFEGGGFLEVGWDWVHLVRWPLLGLLYQYKMMEQSVETFPSAALSTTNPTWPDPLRWKSTEVSELSTASIFTAFLLLALYWFHVWLVLWLWS